MLTITLLLWTLFVCAQTLTQKTIKLYLTSDEQGYLVVNMFLRNSDRILQAKLNSAFKGLLVIDKNCGEKPADCRRYCKETKFAALFCSPLCQPYTPQALKSFCGEEANRYNSSDVDVLTEMSNWRLSAGSSIKMEGIYVQGQLRLIDFGAIRFVDNFTVASGLLVDRHLFTYASAPGNSLLGLAPSSSPSIKYLDALPVQLYHLKIIQYPSLTIAYNQNSILLGDFNQNACNSTTYQQMQTVQKGAWKVELDSLVVPYLGTLQHVITDPGFPGIGVPRDYIMNLVKNNLIEKRTTGYFRKCTDPFKFKFQFKGQEYYIQWPTINNENSTCLLNNFNSLEAHYTDSDQWIFGSKLTENMCLVLDYAKETVGFAHFLY